MPLNIKQKLFCDLYTDIDYEYYGNGTKCYQEVYNCDYESARPLASGLLSNINIQEYINSKNKSVSEILSENANKLTEHALKLSLGLTDKGNVSVLNKLLDKIAPSLAENHNTNANESIDDKIKSLINNLANKTDSKDNSNIPQDKESVSVDNTTT